MKGDCLENLSQIVDAPGFIVPWLDRFYEPAEIRVLDRLNQSPMDTASFKKTMGFSPDTMDRFLKRGVISKHNNGMLGPADFHTRYDIWAVFEGFKDVPDDIRGRLNQWELAHYIRSNQQEVEKIRRTGKLDPLKVIPRYLLLGEALDVLDEVEQVFLWPCNCRSMMRGCKKPVYTCLRFDNSQGQGYEISREKAKEIVVMSNKKGLMQSGELGRNSEGKLAGAICNCCPDCCFPHLLARELKAEKIWPKSVYTAVWIIAECTFCGLCAKRCPFDAFSYDRQKGNKEERLVFCEALCRGCGLCAVTCPTEAIEMKKINEC